MTIEELLKDGSEDYRLTNYRRWLIWNSDGLWQVFVQPYHKQGRSIYCGDSLDDALTMLKRAGKKEG